MTLLHWNILEGNLFLPPRAQERALSFVRSDADVFLTAAWIVLLAAGVLLTHGSKLFG
ncbi:hypothetical protein NKG05_19220 [Oerskovia sp. M15]